jgi:hypothetical protein
MKGTAMSSARFGPISPKSEAVVEPRMERDAAAASSSKPAPRVPVRSGRRAEDTGAGCRANAAADLARAYAPGGDFMRVRLENSAAVWAERASLLERLEKNFQQRKPTA